jgi:hypothetical protein
MKALILITESAILMLLATLAITAHGQTPKHHKRPLRSCHKICYCDYTGTKCSSKPRHHTPVNQCTINGAITECAPKN